MSVKYWTTDKIKKYNADFNMVFGGRSDGKTTAILCEIIKEYVNTGRRGQYVRQLQEDFARGRGNAIMESLAHAGENKNINLILEHSGGKFDTVKYARFAWYLGTKTIDSKGEPSVKWDTDPFCYARAISQVGRDKSATPVNVGIIHVDEFIPINGKYLPNEMKLLTNLLSTTIRASSDVKIYLTANSTTWNSIYFEFFGVEREIQNMLPGQIKVFETIAGDVKSVLAVEYCTPATDGTDGKPSDKYFIWGDNSNARMITSGEFSIPDFPKCPHHFTTKNVKAVFWFIEPDKQTLRVRLMKVGERLFLFTDRVNTLTYMATRKKHDVTYSLEFSSERFHYVNPLLPNAHPASKYFVELLKGNRIFFENNAVGTDFVYFLNRALAKNALNPE